MIEKIEKRRAFIINVVFTAIVIGLFLIIFKYAFWLIFPFVFSFIIAMVLQRPVKFLAEKTPLKRGLAGTLCVMSLLAVLSVLVGGIGVKLAGEIRGFVAYLTEQVNNLPELVETVKAWLLDVVRVLPDSLEEIATTKINEFSIDGLLQSSTSEAPNAQGGGLGGAVGSLFSLLKTPLSGAWSAVKQVPSLLVATIVTIVSCCFMTADYETITSFILRQFPEEKGQNLLRSKKLIVKSLGKLGKAYFFIILITTTELLIGLGFLKLIGVFSGKYILIIAIVTALIDIVPVLGTGTVLLPWALFNLISGKVGLGIGLLVLYAIITVIRQVIEPKIVAGQFDLPAVVTIMSMYIGIKVLGPLGIFLLPITVIVIKILTDEGILHFFHTARSDELARQRQAEALHLAEKENKEAENL